MPSADEVRRIARLAKLGVADAELVGLSEQLRRILELAGALGDTEPEDPIDRTESSADPMPGERSGPDRMTLEPAGLAPEFEDGFFAVPRLSAQRDRAGPSVDDGAA